MEIDHVFLRQERRATSLVRGGASNHGSWRKNVVNSYSNGTRVTLILIEFKGYICNVNHNDLRWLRRDMLNRFS